MAAHRFFAYTLNPFFGLVMLFVLGAAWREQDFFLAACACVFLSCAVSGVSLPLHLDQASVGLREAPGKPYRFLVGLSSIATVTLSIAMAWVTQVEPVQILTLGGLSAAATVNLIGALLPPKRVLQT